jgi:plasmid stability protein
MKTTLDIPDDIMRRVKIRAASEDRKLKDVIAELLQKAMEAPPTEPLAEGEPAYRIDPRTGMAVARTLGAPRSEKVSLAESLSAMERANEEEALSHVRHPR